MEIILPKTLQIEHEALHQGLAKVARLQGAMGEAAREVSKLLLPHVQKEEAFAFPPLGLLPEIAKGHLSSEMESVLPMTDQLRSSHSQLLAEHQMIIAALDVLVSEAMDAGIMDYVRVAEDLIHHMRVEEEIFYPTAMLIGDLVRRGTQG